MPNFSYINSFLSYNSIDETFSSIFYILINPSSMIAIRLRELKKFKFREFI